MSNACCFANGSARKRIMESANNTPSERLSPPSAHALKLSARWISRVVWCGVRAHNFGRCGFSLHRLEVAEPAKRQKVPDGRYLRASALFAVLPLHLIGFGLSAINYRVVSTN